MGRVLRQSVSERGEIAEGYRQTHEPPGARFSDILKATLSLERLASSRVARRR
jgi:hypothetical protein